MKKLLAILITLLTIDGFSQMTLNSVTLPVKLNVDKTDLTLNGGGIRKKAFFKVYVIGLYTTAKTANAADILKDDKEVAVRLQITSSVVSSSNMTESIREGFEKSTKGNTAALKSRIDAFIQTFSKEPIKEGDVFIISYDPGVGVKAYKNGKFQSTTPGEDFKTAFFGIWLSETPIDADLKAALLSK